MHKILSTIILTTLLILGSAVTGLAAWQLTLDITTPDPHSDTGIASNKLTAGADPSATDSYDNKLDTIALLDGPIQAYFPHPEYPSGQQKLWRDFRTELLPKEWPIEVQSEVNSQVSINWGINAPDNLKFTLTDQESNKEITMTSSTEYSYSNTTNTPKRFLLKVSGDTSISGGNYSAGSSKGGGCGYIKNTRQRGYPMNEYGQIAINLIILITPLLLTLKFHIRGQGFVIVKKQYYR